MRCARSRHAETRAPYNVRMSEPAFNWKKPAGRALELALNRALALDEDTRAALPALDGQRVALTVASPPLALQQTQPTAAQA